MNKFIFYKGKYYTKQSIDDILYHNNYLKNEKDNINLECLLVFIIGLIGIKIGTLL